MLRNVEKHLWKNKKIECNSRMIKDLSISSVSVSALVSIDVK